MDKKEFVSLKKSPRRYSYIPILIVIVFAGLLRVSLALYLSPDPIWPDGELYQGVAERIISEGQYPMDKLGAPPLQSMVLALVYSIFGTSGTAVRIVIAIFGTLTCLVLYKTSNKLFGRPAGIVAATVLAIYPLHVYLSGLYEYPQTIFILLLCLTIHQLVCVFKKPDVWFGWISSGFLLGLAAMSVPTILTAAPFIAIWLICIGRHVWRKQLLRVMVFTIVCSIVVFSWSIYIYSNTGEFCIGSKASSKTLFKGNCSLAWVIGKGDIADRYDKEGAPAEHKEAYEDYNRIMAEARQFPKGVARDVVYKDAVKIYMKEQPKEFALLFLRKAYLYWCPYAITVEHTSHTHLKKIIQIMSFVPIFIFGVIGIIIYKKDKAILMPIYITMMSQWVIYSIFIVTSRYRSHVDVLLILLASPVIVTFLNKITSKSSADKTA